MLRNLTFATIVVMTTTGTIPHHAGAASYGDDAAFLKRHTEVIELSDAKGLAKVAVVSAWQGRVMTSTAGADAGLSFGWINRELIASGKLLPHMNAFGGEDRFWMGPEGGQFSIFFAKGVKFEFENWFTPAAFDTLPFKTLRHSRTKAVFASEFMLTNYSGARFEVAVNREVRLLNTKAAWQKLGVPPAAEVSVVAYESDNKITNRGKHAWQKNTGLLSIWILGMFTPSPSATIVVPIKRGPESELGVKVTSDYFGQIPPERLVVRDDVIFFSADGKYRSKIGINPKRARGVSGSYDADNKVLTIAQYTLPSGATDYVNSLWKLQDNPYAGDAANCYNDGPPAPGAKPMGPFFELESSSPAAALAPGKSLSHVHRTIHLRGPEAALDAVARRVLGVSIADIKTALKTR
ncbi:MAG TPA: hypothetical protein PLL56_14505 [Verrucomicrobiota bacterium]|jgi:hypothetical protein|nr:hypothetical protein [Verrucomicrobiota bacterium]HRD03780.1 hypothetical protein [Verrucomicrobiota bacterium]